MRNGSQSDSTFSSIPAGVASETYHSASRSRNRTRTRFRRSIPVSQSPEARALLALGYHQDMEIAEHPTETLIDLTPLAAEKVKELMAAEPDAESLVLRVAIQGGGCSGFQYGLGFDSGAAEGDHELVLEGVRVVVDPFSAPYLQGAKIDYLNGIQESGFKVDNPNAVSSCGCGHSFQVEEGEELPEGTEMGGCGSGCSH